VGSTPARPPPFHLPFFEFFFWIESHGLWPRDDAPGVSQPVRLAASVCRAYNNVHFSIHSEPRLRARAATKWQHLLQPLVGRSLNWRASSSRFNSCASPSSTVLHAIYCLHSLKCARNLFPSNRSTCLPLQHVFFLSPICLRLSKSIHLE
jgi:hypothetical protein